MRFEPAGMTNDADIRVAKSIVDYIFRWMGKKFLSTDQQEEAGILTADVKARLAAAYADAGPGAAAAVAARARDVVRMQDGRLADRSADTRPVADAHPAATTG